MDHFFFREMDCIDTHSDTEIAQSSRSHHQSIGVVCWSLLVRGEEEKRGEEKRGEERSYYE